MTVGILIALITVGLLVYLSLWVVGMRLKGEEWLDAFALGAGRGLIVLCVLALFFVVGGAIVSYWGVPL